MVSLTQEVSDLQEGFMCTLSRDEGCLMLWIVVMLQIVEAVTVKYDSSFSPSLEYESVKV